MAHLVDGKAIECGITTPWGVPQVIHFYMAVAQNATVCDWLTKTDGSLHLGHLLSIVGWSIDHDRLNCKNKSLVARHLCEKNPTLYGIDEEAIRRFMTRTVHPDAVTIIKKIK